MDGSLVPTRVLCFVFRLVHVSVAYVSVSSVHAFGGHRHGNPAVVPESTPSHRYGNTSSSHMLHHAPSHSAHHVCSTRSPVSKRPKKIAL